MQVSYTTVENIAAIIDEMINNLTVVKRSEK
jgi:hypothetical protein